MKRQPIDKSDHTLKYIYRIDHLNKAPGYKIDIYDPRKLTEDGQPKRNRSVFNSLDNAINEIREILNYKTLSNIGNQPIEKEKMNFHELMREAENFYFNDFSSKRHELGEEIIKERWRKHPGASYRRILKDISNIPIEAINYKNLKEYSDKLLKRNSISLHNKIIWTLKKVFNYGIYVKELLDKDPTVMLKPVPEKIDPDFRKPIEPQTLHEILNYFNESKILLAWLLATNCGLRHKDLLGIEIKNINFEKGYIVISETKTKDSDPIPKVTPLTSYMCSILKKGCVGGKTFLFESKYGTKLKDLRRYREKVKEDLKLNEEFGFHQLRHTFASRLADNGVDEEIISFLLFHSTGSSIRTITRRYIHSELGKRIEKAISYRPLLEKVEIKI